MKKFSECCKDCLITASLLALSFGVSLLFQYIFAVQEHITTVFVFAVFLISLWTNGYVYGIFAAFAGTVAVNYAFTFPFFKLNFTDPVNIISGIVMIVVSILTSALTTKLKCHEATKAESERERMRANLLRAVSHDLRTPLTTIYASATTLLEHNVTEEQQRSIAMGIKEDAQWLIRLVENLLSITRIDSGRVKILKAPTVLEELIDSVLLKFKKRYAAQRVLVEIPEEMAIIPMDAILIEQVLINLLENAVQHAHGMTRLALSVAVDVREAVFTIEDDGCGIVPAREEIADGQKNAGIGLAVCTSIIKAHGGEIRTENRKGGGTTVRFTLPLAG